MPTIAAPRSALSLVALALAALLAAPLVLGANAPKYGPAEAPRAIPLSRDHDYLRRAPAPDFWALIPYYVPQLNEAACSVASVAMVVNAAVRAGRPLGNEDRNVTQQALLDKVRDAQWKERVSAGNLPLRHGLTLAQLGEVTAASLQAFGDANAAVATVPADGSSEGLARFRATLAANETSAREALLLHFVQDELTDAPGGPYPHISPVGAYDAEHRRVLILDVDREWYEPYWVSDEVLWRALSRKTIWFGAGGYVRATFGD